MVKKADRRLSYHPGGYEEVLRKTTQRVNHVSWYTVEVPAGFLQHESLYVDR